MRGGYVQRITNVRASIITVILGLERGIRQGIFVAKVVLDILVWRVQDLV
jgi:hypothetical protein